MQTTMDPGQTITGVRYLIPKELSSSKKEETEILFMKDNNKLIVINSFWGIFEASRLPPIPNSVRSHDFTVSKKGMANIEKTAQLYHKLALKTEELRNALFQNENTGQDLRQGVVITIYHPDKANSSEYPREIYIETRRYNSEFFTDHIYFNSNGTFSSKILGNPVQRAEAEEKGLMTTKRITHRLANKIRKTYGLKKELENALYVIKQDHIKGFNVWKQEKPQFNRQAKIACGAAVALLTSLFLVAVVKFKNSYT